MTKTTTKRKVVWKYSLMPFLVFLVIFFLLSRPIGLPIVVSEMTHEVYSYYQQLKPGDIVLCLAEPEAGSNNPLTASMHYFWTHGIRWIGFSNIPKCQAYTLDCLRLSGMLDESLHPDYKYGEDWVFFGVIPGTEASMKLAISSFEDLARADYLGTPVSDLPLLQGIHDYHSFAMLTSAGEIQEYHAKLWPRSLGIPSIIISPTDAYPNALVYYPDRFSAILNGLIGSAELEYLQGWPARGLAGCDALSGSIIVTIVCVIIAQIEVALRIGTEKEVVHKEA